MTPKIIHIKLFPQRDAHLFFSVPGVRDHGGQAKEGNKKSKAILQQILNINPR